jgi:hypothetical protein
MELLEHQGSRLLAIKGLMQPHYLALQC